MLYMNAGKGRHVDETANIVMALVRSYLHCLCLLCLVGIVAFVPTQIKVFSPHYRTAALPARSRPVRKVKDSTQSTNTNTNNTTPSHEYLAKWIYTTNKSPTVQSPLHEQLRWIATTNNEHNFFSAYYDGRSEIRMRPAVVLIGYGLEPTNLFCNLKFDDGRTTCSSQSLDSELVAQGKYLFPWEKLTPRYYYCRLAPNDDVPLSVAISIVKTCNPSNTSGFIQVQNRKQLNRLKSVGVCVGGPLVQTTNSKKQLQILVEFIEMTRALGGESITLYSINSTAWVNDGLTKRYSDSDKFSLRIIQWRNFERWIPFHYHGQTMILNDCLYRNMYKVKYLAFMDLDEVIYPTQNNWLWLIKQIEQKRTAGSYKFVNFFFRTQTSVHDINAADSEASQKTTHLCNVFEMPKYFSWTSRLVGKRTSHYYRTKFFVRPPFVVDVGIHEVCQHHPGYRKYNVHVSIGYLAHYRVEVLPEYEHLHVATDRTALQYKDQIVKEMRRNCPPDLENVTFY